mmetsp:Transcript_79161/g.189992  ORF Transcript_79161/g.189992 Transcript_79161/m.189992 type:complete len:201 (+) Transcript_79161:421-1023(+)
MAKKMKKKKQSSVNAAMMMVIKMSVGPNPSSCRTLFTKCSVRKPQASSNSSCVMSPEPSESAYANIFSIMLGSNEEFIAVKSFLNSSMVMVPETSASRVANTSPGVTLRLVRSCWNSSKAAVDSSTFFFAVARFASSFRKPLSMALLCLCSWISCCTVLRQLWSFSSIIEKAFFRIIVAASFISFQSVTTTTPKTITAAP